MVVLWGAFVALAIAVAIVVVHNSAGVDYSVAVFIPSVDRFGAARERVWVEVIAVICRRYPYISATCAVDDAVIVSIFVVYDAVTVGVLAVTRLLRSEKNGRVCIIAVAICWGHAIVVGISEGAEQAGELNLGDVGCTAGVADLQWI
jgi:hypothetical protein